MKSRELEQWQHEIKMTKARNKLDIIYIWAFFGLIFVMTFLGAPVLLTVITVGIVVFGYNYIKRELK